VNRNAITETFSYPCPSTTIDAYVERQGITADLFVKLEIQGGEYHALLGAQHTLANQCFGLLVKFIPHALSPMIDPEQVLSVLPSRPYRLYDVGFYHLFWNGERVQREIEAAQFSAFTAQLRQSKPDFTFLLVLFE